MRILMTPDAEASGGSEAVVDPKVEVKPLASKSAPTIDPAVAADLAELRALRADKSQREAEAKAKADADLREKGRYEDLLKSREAELATSRAEKVESDRRAMKSVLDRDLALELAKQNLRPGAAKHLTKLLADDLEAVPDGDGGYVVRSKDRRSVADYIAETLKHPDYDAFVSSTAKPGVVQGGGTKSVETGATQAPPRTLGEAIENVFKDRAINAPDSSMMRPRGFRPGK